MMKTMLSTLIICITIYFVCGMIFVPYNARKNNSKRLINIKEKLQIILQDNNIKSIKTKINDLIKTL